MNPFNRKRSAAQVAPQCDADGRATKRSRDGPPVSRQTTEHRPRKCAVCHEVRSYESQTLAKTFLCPRCHSRNEIGVDGNGVAECNRTRTAFHYGPGFSCGKGQGTAGRAVLTIMPPTEDDGLLQYTSPNPESTSAAAYILTGFMKEGWEQMALARSADAEASYFDVKEKALIMDTVLRHIYGLPVALLSINYRASDLDVAHNELVNLVALRNAAVKYDLPDLGEAAEQNFYPEALKGAPARLTNLGVNVFASTDSAPMRKAVVAACAASFKEVVDDENAWYNLYSTEAFAKEVCKAVCRT